MQIRKRAVACCADENRAMSPGTRFRADAYMIMIIRLTPCTIPDAACNHLMQRATHNMQRTPGGARRHRRTATHFTALRRACSDAT